MLQGWYSCANCGPAGHIDTHHDRRCSVHHGDPLDWQHTLPPLTTGLLFPVDHPLSSSLTQGGNQDPLELPHNFLICDCSVATSRIPAEPDKHITPILDSLTPAFSSSCLCLYCLSISYSVDWDRHFIVTLVVIVLWVLIVVIQRQTESCRTTLDASHCPCPR